MKPTILIFHFLLFFLPLFSCYDVEEDMTMGQIIEHWGYPMEKFDVITKDGYILELFRIKHGKNDHNISSNCNRPPILLVHGLSGNGAQFVVNQPNQSAAFVFADGGLDVFIMNHRGNTYGKRHVTMQSSDKRFWQFSLDEFAKYDIPAVVDKIIELTGHPSIYYLGHSQGTLVGMMSLAENPSYNKKVKGMFMLAPVGTAKYTRGSSRLYILIYNWLFPIPKFYATFMGSNEMSSSIPSQYRNLIDNFCAPTNFHEFCESVEFLSDGAQNKAFNSTRLRVYLTHFPGGTSTWNILHWGQLAHDGVIKHFDLNPIDNMIKYGQVTAPLYNFTLVESPIHLFSSENDWLAKEEGIERIYINSTIPGVIKSNYRVNEFNHLDWIIAMNAVEKVYKPILQIIDKEETLECSEH